MLFDYPENDRSQREIKNDYAVLKSRYNEKLKFRNVVGKWMKNFIFDRLLLDVKLKLSYFDKKDRCQGNFIKYRSAVHKQPRSRAFQWESAPCYVFELSDWEDVKRNRFAFLYPRLDTDKLWAAVGLTVLVNGKLNISNAHSLRRSENWLSSYVWIR